MWPFRKRHLPLESFPVNEDWAIAIGERDGKRTFIRIHLGAKPYAGHPGLPYCLSVIVPFLFPDEEGMPDEDEKEVLDDIEDSLREILGPAARGFMVVIATANGAREFLLYTRDAEAANAAIAVTRKCSGEREIQSEILHDPKWVAYKHFT